MVWLENNASQEVLDLQIYEYSPERIDRIVRDLPGARDGGAQGGAADGTSTPSAVREEVVASHSLPLSSSWIMNKRVSPPTGEAV